MPFKDKSERLAYRRAYGKAKRTELNEAKREYRETNGRENRSNEYANRNRKLTETRNNPFSREIVAVDGEGKSVGSYHYHYRFGNVVSTDTQIPYRKHDNWPPESDNRMGKYGATNTLSYYTQDHIYTVLMASTGDYIENAAGLSTRDCFNFLLGLAKPERLIVGYSFSYDVNMMLRDVDEKRLQRLHDTGYVRWHNYSINWIPRKMLSIGRDDGKRVTVWDIFGYFQKRFVDALAEWQVTDTDTASAIDAMKLKRGAFDKENDADIREYCFSECRECVSLMRKLLDCTQSADVKLTRFDGAGSIASAILKREKVKAYMIASPDDEQIGLRAYYGGRFELRNPGIYDKLYTYDINSAYPSALVNAPCLTHSQFIAEAFDVHTDIGLCLVEWDLAPGVPEWKHLRHLQGGWLHNTDKPVDEPPAIAYGFGPFPVRSYNIRPEIRELRGEDRETASIIRYPARGKGVYWSTEVKEAMALYPGKIRVIEQWRLVQQCDDKPFEFIRELFAYRRTLKKRGDLGHLVIKLGINSLYGKTAQSMGSKGKRPPYQNWLIASWTTAHCRANILKAIRLSNDGVVYIATDGVISTQEIPELPVGSDLGEWEADEIHNVFLARPNLYSYEEHGELKVKCGGLTKKETSIDVLRDDFLLHGTEAKRYAIVNRFVGLGTALMRHTLETAWRKWSTERKQIRAYQHNRMQLEGTPPYSRLQTVMYPAHGYESDCYRLKTKWKDSYEDSDETQKMALEFIDYLPPLSDEGQV